MELDSQCCTIAGEISLADILIDGYEKSRIDTSVLQDREQLSESGVVIIEICTDKKTGRLASGINIECRGFLDEKNFKALAEGLKDSISSEISRFIAQGVNDDRIRKGVEELARGYITAKSGKNPLVIVLVTKVML